MHCYVALSNLIISYEDVYQLFKQEVAKMAGQLIICCKVVNFVLIKFLWISLSFLSIICNLISFICMLFNVYCLH